MSAIDPAGLAVALAHYPYRVWGFGESIAMEALLAFGGDPGRVAEHLIRTWAGTHPALVSNPLSHVAPGVPVLALAGRTGDASLLRRAIELGELHAGLRVGRHGARIHRPDLAGWEHEVWVDNMHLTGPFLARLGGATGEGRWHDLAAALILSHARVLQGDDGLFSHGFDDATGRANQVRWGRGQGWALLGLTDTLEALPGAHSARAEIAQRLHGLAAGLARWEDGEWPGRWHTVLDRSDTYIESSVGAFVALGIERAVARGHVPVAHRAMARRALVALAGFTTPDGAFGGTSDATPVGLDVAHYAARPRGVYPWGQAPALLALLECAPPAEVDSTSA